MTLLDDVVGVDGDGGDEDEADDSDGYGGRRSPTPESFYLGSIQELSPTYPT